MSALELADVKEHLNITRSDTDVELQKKLDAAEATIARRIGALTPTTYTERVTGRRPMLTLKHTPVVTLTSLVPTGATTGLDVDDLVVDRDAGVVESAATGAAFPAVAYDVVYSAGWVDLPADIDEAIKELTRHLWLTQRGPAARPGSTASDALANTVPGAAYSLPIRVQQLIEHYIPLAGL